MTNVLKKSVSSKEDLSHLDQLFSDFGEYFGPDIPDVAKALDFAIKRVVFSYEGSGEVPYTETYITLNLLYLLRDYINEKLISGQ